MTFFSTTSVAANHNVKPLRERFGTILAERERERERERHTQAHILYTYLIYFLMFTRAGVCAKTTHKNESFKIRFLYSYFLRIKLRGKDFYIHKNSFGQQSPARIFVAGRTMLRPSQSSRKYPESFRNDRKSFPIDQENLPIDRKSSPIVCHYSLFTINYSLKNLAYGKRKRE
jgi:hypothetical protein